MCGGSHWTWFQTGRWVRGYFVSTVGRDTEVITTEQVAPRVGAA